MKKKSKLWCLYVWWHFIEIKLNLNFTDHIIPPPVCNTHTHTHKTTFHNVVMKQTLLQQLSSSSMQLNIFSFFFQNISLLSYNFKKQTQKYSFWKLASCFVQLLWDWVFTVIMRAWIFLEERKIEVLKVTSVLTTAEGKSLWHQQHAWCQNVSGEVVAAGSPAAAPSAPLLVNWGVALCVGSTPQSSPGHPNTSCGACGIRFYISSQQKTSLERSLLGFHYRYKTLPHQSWKRIQVFIRQQQMTV